MYKLKRIFKWPGIIIVIIMLSIAMRVFLFAIFSIPTPSMEPAIIPGDRIVVNKMIPGPRIVKNFFSPKNRDRFNYVRLPGWKDIERNDILVFNSPYNADWEYLIFNLNKFFVKRCMAIPGDTFYIENGIYKVKGETGILGNYNEQKTFYLREKELIEPDIYKCFPHDPAYNWNVKDFGPFYIPAAGDVISIDTMSIALYKNLIRYETGKEVSIKGNTVWLGSDTLGNYTFTKNYYFVAGDMISASVDSRYWGPLPEEHIVGKASFVYKSVDPNSGSTRWERFLKSIK